MTVVTLTINPAIDISTSTETIVATRKLRCAEARRDPGGGGVNVARVVRRLGSSVSAIYPAGGCNGQLLKRLIDDEGVKGLAVPVTAETREDFTVVERSSGQQFRFVLPGAYLAENEWQACLDLLQTNLQPNAFLVASGSLPPGVPDDFYARVARIAKKYGSKLVLDTSGMPLAAALEEGVYLFKPNLRELQELSTEAAVDQAGQLVAIRKIIAGGGAEIVALTLGSEGAILVTKDTCHLARTPEIQAVSTVGAGDSFLGAMVWRLAAGGAVTDAFRYGVAAGSAAVLNPGTELSKQSDVERLCKDIAVVPL